MRETSGIEVESQPVRLRPGDPLAEVRRPDRVAVHRLAAEFAIHGVQVHPVSARDERQGFLKVRAEFVGRAGLAGIVAGDRDSSAERVADVFETTDVVAPPSAA
jgi:hypothetical protein